MGGSNSIHKDPATHVMFVAACQSPCIWILFCYFLLLEFSTTHGSMGALVCVDHLYTCTKELQSLDVLSTKVLTGRQAFQWRSSARVTPTHTLCVYWYVLTALSALYCTSIVSEELFVRWAPAGVYCLVVAMCSVPLTRSPCWWHRMATCGGFESTGCYEIIFVV